MSFDSFSSCAMTRLLQVDRFIVAEVVERVDEEIEMSVRRPVVNRVRHVRTPVETEVWKR